MSTVYAYCTLSDTSLEICNILLHFASFSLSVRNSTQYELSYMLNDLSYSNIILYSWTKLKQNDASAVHFSRTLSISLSYSLTLFLFKCEIIIWNGKLCLTCKKFCFCSLWIICRETNCFENINTVTASQKSATMFALGERNIHPF